MLLLFGGARGFSAGRISGLTAWYETSNTANLSLVGSAITKFLDISGNNNNTDDQGTAAARPTHTASQINGLSCAVFDGGDYLVSTSVIPALRSGIDKAVTAFCVSSQTTIGSDGYQYIWGKSDTTTPLMGLRYDASSIYRVLKRDDSTTLKQPSGGNPVSGVANISSMVTNGTAVDLYINNTLRITAGDIDLGTTTINNFTIGASFRNAIASLWLTGKIGEILIYNRALTSTEVTLVNRYLGNKWGITVA